MSPSASELTSADVRRAVDFTRQLAARDTTEEFAHHVAAGLYALVECDFASFNEIDPIRGEAHFATVPDGVLFADAPQAFIRNVDEHPIVAHYASTSSPRTRRLSEFLSVREFRNLRLYDEVFRQLDSDYLLTSPPIVFPAPAITGFALHRSGRDFSPREHMLVDLVTPGIKLAFDVAVATVAATALAAVLDHEERPVLVIDRHGRLRYTTFAARELLARLEMDCREGMTVPVTLPRTSSAPRRGTWRGLTWELLPVQDDWAVVLTETTRRVGQRWGLSGREEEILGLIAEARSTAAIADTLFISPHTVRRHTESIFRKLGVHSRAGAAAAYLRESHPH
jgi:DNA-binding CsgD family transcriptional regulator